MGYIFGGNTGIKDAAELDRERMLVEALMGRQAAPKNLGEGLTALGEALGYRMAKSRLAKDEGAASEAGNVLFQSLFGGQKDPAEPAQPASYSTDPVEQPTPEPSFGETFLPKIQPAPEPEPVEDLTQGAFDLSQSQPVPEPMATPEPQQVAQADAVPGTPEFADLIQKYEMVLSDPNFQHVDQQRQKLAYSRYQQLLEAQQKASDPMTQLEMDYKRAQIKKLGMSNGGDGAEYGLQPIITQEGPNDPNPGKYHLYQADKAGGKPREMELPYGWTPKMQFLNQETQFAPVATQGILQPGQGPAPIPINNEQSAIDTKVGGEIGDARALYSSMTSKMPGLERVVEDLGTLADKATYTTAGQVYNYGRKELGLDPTAAAVARAEYVAMVDNQVLPMLRDTFGAQFTVVEGETLRKTLGDPNKAPAEKKAVLKAFIEQKRRNIEAQAMQGNIAIPPQGGKPADWTDEEWNALTPEEKAQFGQ